MAEPIEEKEGEEEEEEEAAESTTGMECSAERMSRKEKRKAKKKMKRKQIRKEIAEKEREEEEARLKDPEEQRKLRMMEEEEKERAERERREFEERERAWIEAMERKKKEEKEEEERRKALEEEEKLKRAQVENENEHSEGDDWEYVEEGPAEIIWQGNEIIVKKKRVRVPKKVANQQTGKENADRPTSNPLPPQSEAFANYKNAAVVSAEQTIENVAQQVSNFGTEQDKAHCPFHLKTGTCRFGLRCSRVHFYPDKSCTLLIRNMYNGPGLVWEQDEGLEYTDEEVERSYEEFYEDVHTEFLKFGEIVNFKVCRNGSFHLRGNVYVQYKSLDSAVLAYHSINGRYFAGKQVGCEYVNITRWKVAICGEYMKSRYKTCSHGTACNFIHCFRNPGGDYEWADFDKPPPKYWVKKMVALFGYSDEAGYEKQVEQEKVGLPRSSSKMSIDDRSRSRISKSKEEMDYFNAGGSSSRNYTENDVQKSRQRRWHAIDDRKQIEVIDEDMYEENKNVKDRYYRQSGSHDRDSNGEQLDKDGGRDRYKDSHHPGSRKSSRHQKGGKHRMREAEYEGDWMDGNEDRETHRPRKSSRHSEKAESLDQEKVIEDWSDREGNKETGHAHMTKVLKHQRTVGHPDDHGNSRSRSRDSDGERSDRDGDRGDHHHKRRTSSRRQREREDDHDNSKNRSHNLGGEVSDKDIYSDRHHKHHSRRRKSSREDRKVSESSDGRGIGKDQADDTDVSYDWSGSDGEKRHSHKRKHNKYWNEVSNFSDDEEELAKKSKGRFHNRESSIDKSDLERDSVRGHSRRRHHLSRHESLKSDESHESSS